MNFTKQIWALSYNDFIPTNYDLSNYKCLNKYSIPICSGLRLILNQMNYIKISEIRVLNLNQLYDFEFELRDSLKGGIVMDCVFTGIVSKKGQVVIPIQTGKL